MKKMNGEYSSDHKAGSRIKIKKTFLGGNQRMGNIVGPAVSGKQEEKKNKNKTFYRK
jgi:hypothetical protein